MPVDERDVEANRAEDGDASFIILIIGWLSTGTNLLSDYFHTPRPFFLRPFFLGSHFLSELDLSYRVFYRKTVTLLFFLFGPLIIGQKWTIVV